MQCSDNQKSIFKGNKISVEVFGASHAEKMGVKLSGLDGKTFDKKSVDQLLKRRAPNTSAYSTTRKEPDTVVYESGATLDGDHIQINGDLTATIYNTNQRSTDYSKTYKKPRPGHADFVGYTKYGDGFDYRGGGKFSGRMTAPICIAGAICKELLQKRGIKINAYLSQIGAIKGKCYNDIDVETFDFDNMDKSFPTIDGEEAKAMLSFIENARQRGDSVGGVIECVITGVDAGVGEFMFDSIEGQISRLAFSIPAVKGVEFGTGFYLSSLSGSSANDSFIISGGKVKTKTNHNGGINGGISNGMPITFRVAIKPTPSIAIEQDTVDLQTMQPCKIQITGRHDACIAPRAVACIEAIAAIAIYDMI